jgi:pyruvate,water dikinase
MTADFISLTALQDTDAPNVGGKAIGLARARRHGAPVPRGFVVTQTAFNAVLAHSGLGNEFLSLLDAAAHEAADLAERAARFGDRLMSADWPRRLDDALAEQLEKLPGGTFAVRSSATLEDTDTSAAAGLFHTELGVARPELRRAIRTCWAAALRPEVFHHLLAFGQDPRQLRVALVIMPMLAPQAAGVLFTTDPDDAERQAMRLALTAGLGEALVQGDAGTDHRLPKRGEPGTAAGLSSAVLGQLRGLGLKLEAAFGRAMDLEWAVEDGKVWLLQARPIASLPPGAESRPAIRWSRDLATERFPDPISPLGWTALQSALRVNLQTLDRRFGLQAKRPEEVATVIGGYVYNNRDFFAIPGSMRFRAKAHLPYAGRYAKALAGVLAPGSLLRVGALWAPKRGALGSGPHDPRVRAIAGLFEAYLFAHAREVEKAWKRDFPRHLEAMDTLDGVDVRRMGTADLLRHARRVIERSDTFMEPDLAIYVLKMACRWAVEELAALVDGEKRPGVLAALTGGLEANATMAMNAALEALHQAVAADERLSQALVAGHADTIQTAWEASPAREARDGFLRDFGHVTLSWDIRHPTYRDRPALLDDLLAQRLRAPSPLDQAARREALAAAREAETQRIATALAPAPAAEAFFREVLSTLHTFMRLDEEHHLYCGRLIPAERRIVAALADRLVGAGAFDAPDDIHFLTLDEVFAIGEELAQNRSLHSRRRLVARRRSAYERAIAQRPVEEYLGTSPVRTATVPAAGADGSAALVGQPASPGRAEGVVRVVTGMAEMAAFQPGEILVVPTPKPSYTPLFAVAAAVVTARGSTLSHGLITAREYGLPAVTELHDALDRLSTGQRVVVDGDTGAVTVLAPAECPTIAVAAP